MQIRWSFALPPPLASILILRKKPCIFINFWSTKFKPKSNGKPSEDFETKSYLLGPLIWQFFPKPTHKCNRAVKSVSGSVNSRCTIIMLVECTNSNCSRTFFTLFFFCNCTCEKTTYSTEISQTKCVCIATREGSGGSPFRVWREKN